MNFLFSGTFWGIFLILIGITIVINKVFNVNVPIFRIFAALFFIFLGIKILTGGMKSTKKSDVVFNDLKIDASGDAKEYNIVFGRGVVDLSVLSADNNKIKINTIFGNGIVEAGDIPLQSDNIFIEFNNIFSGGEMIIKKGQPVKIKIDSVFGGSEFPDGSTSAFGTYYYTSPTFDKDKPHLYVKAGIVFGGLQIKENN